MSSYDKRTRIQIKIDELILKYNRRIFDYEKKNNVYDEADTQIYKQLKLIQNDLNEIKIFLDMEAVKNGKRNNKNNN